MLWFWTLQFQNMSHWTKSQGDGKVELLSGGCWKERITSFSQVLPCMCVCVCVSCSIVCLCDPMDCSPLGPSVHGILQVRILEWVAMPFSRGSSQPGDQTRGSCTAGGFFIFSSYFPNKSAFFYPHNCWPIVHTLFSLLAWDIKRIF